MSRQPSEGKLAELSLSLLKELGINTEEEGVVRTPKRFARALAELTQGYHHNVDELVNNAIFESDYSEMVVVKKIEFFSLCEHHILPFFGFAHVAYVPDGKIIGLSKIPRIVKMFARRLQVQERLTDQITDTLQQLLKPKGAACVLEASHMCMMMRGVQSRSGSMVTSSMRGCFLENLATRNEFMQIVSRVE